MPQPLSIDANGQITVAVELTNSQVYGFNVVADDGTDTTSVGVSATAIAATPALSFGSETIDNQAWVVGTAASVTLPEATGGNGNDNLFPDPYLANGYDLYSEYTGFSGQHLQDALQVRRLPIPRRMADSAYTATLTFTVVVTAVAITIPNIPNQSWTVGTAV